jgi:hypothetical protein
MPAGFVLRHDDRLCEWDDLNDHDHSADDVLFEHIHIDVD